MIQNRQTLNHGASARGPGEDVLARLGAALPRLSAKMAHLAGFVADQYARVAFMSTRELAAATGVSLATVVRFPAALGYRNFEEFRTRIQERVNFDLTGVERWRTLPGTGRSCRGLLRRVLDADAAALAALARDFRDAEFDRVLGAIVNARRVTILAFRYAGALAAYFAYALGKIRPGVRGFTRGDSSLYDHIRLMERDDVLVAIAFARYPADLVRMVRYARSLDRRVVAITDSPLSPLCALADGGALFAKGSVQDFVGSLAAPGALVNCLVSAAGVRLGDRALRRLQKLEEAAGAAGLYVQAGRAGRAGRAGAAPGPLAAWDGAGVGSGRRRV
jgi:DNA-binding MurR/RpiR family transcriptional regulator